MDVLKYSTISLGHFIVPRDGLDASGSTDPSFSNSTYVALYGSDTLLSTLKGPRMVRALLPAGTLDQMTPVHDPRYFFVQRPALS